jgi:hypothetical protein
MTAPPETAERVQIDLDGTPAQITAQLAHLDVFKRADGSCPQCDPGTPEYWVPVPGWPHRVSSHGRRRQAITGRILTDQPMNRPTCRHERGCACAKYRKTTLCKPGRPGSPGLRRTTTVHAVLLLGFRGPRPEGQESSHEDDIPDHNHAGNLEYRPPDGNAARKSIQARWHTPQARARRSEAARRSAATNRRRRQAQRDQDTADLRRGDSRSPIGRLWAWLTGHPRSPMTAGYRRSGDR